MQELLNKEKDERISRLLLSFEKRLGELWNSGHSNRTKSILIRSSLFLFYLAAAWSAGACASSWQLYSDSTKTTEHEGLVTDMASLSTLEKAQHVSRLPSRFDLGNCKALLMAAGPLRVSHVTPGGSASKYCLAGE